MVFLEAWARPLLVGHALVGLALVAVTTHLAVWLWRATRGQTARVAGVRRFARIAAALYVTTFVVGNLLYPAYKTRVRSEHLDEGGSLSRDWQNRERSREAVVDRYRGARGLYRGTPTTAIPEASARAMPPNLGYRSAKIARWFDVKEHWVALGMILCLALAVILHAWNPKRHPPVIAKTLLALAVATSAVTWFGAIVGLAVSSYRAVGPLG